MTFFYKIVRFVIVCISLGFFTAPAFSDNLPHQQLTMDYLQLPTPFKADNKYYLVYENILTNYEVFPIKLTSFQANQFTFKNKDLYSMVFNIASVVPSGGKGFQIIFKPSDNKPKKITLKFGSNDDEQQDNLILKSGESKLFMVWLPYDSMSAIPDKITQTISYQIQSDSDKSNGKYSVTSAPLNIIKTAPIIVSPPLSGEKWVAANAASNTSLHRTAHIIVNGHLYFAQRYAIDFIQVDKNGKSYSGPISENKSYYCYGKKILSATSGKVIEVLDNVPENVPNSGKLAISVDFNNAGGNHVIVKIDNKHYAFYAHLIPGSVAVKKGDEVKVGQLLGKVGNSGNSSEPHLHFHIVDGPSFLGANGIPYSFNSFDLLKDFDAKPVRVMNQLVLENAMMNFPTYKNE